MKSFSLVAIGVIAFGSLALSGCSGCSEEPETESMSVPQTTCGPGTRKVGTECIANNSSTPTNAQPLSTSGNN